MGESKNGTNQLKKPMNAYMLFSKEKRAEIIQQKPELKAKVEIQNKTDTPT